MYNSAEELLQAIFKYMNLLVGEKDYYKTLTILTELGRVLVCADRTSFWCWDKVGKQYWTLASSGTDRICIPEGTGIVGASIANKETIIIDSPYEDVRFNPDVDKSTGYRTKSILCMPVTNEQGEVIGAYQAINKLGDEGVFNQRDVDRLAMAAVYCGKMLENHLLQAESKTDRLTGLRNRHYAERAYKLALEGYKDVSVIMCDIDHFKKVNDTYGHNGGDAVLVNIANILKNCVGQKGEVIRWGGEEFLVIVDYSLEEGAKFAELMRERVQQSICAYEKHIIKVTMSFGVIGVDGETSMEDNVNRADEKLYEAKVTRNTVAW